jgi:hypothetical protein
MSSEVLVNEEDIYNALYGQRIKDWYIKKDVAVFTFIGMNIQLEIRPICKCGNAQLAWYTLGEYSNDINVITDITYNGNAITITENMHKRRINAYCNYCKHEGSRLLCMLHHNTI